MYVHKSTHISLSEPCCGHQILCMKRFNASIMAELKMFELSFYNVDTLLCWPCGMPLYVKKKLCTSQEGFSFVFSIILNKPLLIRKYTNIFIVVIVVFFPLKHLIIFHFLSFFYSPSQIRRFTLLFLIPFPFHYHRFCSKLRDDDGNDEGKIKKKHKIADKDLKPTNWNGESLCECNELNPLIRDMTIILLLFASAKPNDSEIFD